MASGLCPLRDDYIGTRFQCLIYVREALCLANKLSSTLANTSRKGSRITKR